MQGDSETVEDIETIVSASSSDHSCITEFIEIVPLDRDREFIYPLVEVKPDQMQDVKMEFDDKNDNQDYSVTLVSTLICSRIDGRKSIVFHSSVDFRLKQHQK